MSEGLIVAIITSLLALVGTALGSWGGIRAANKLTNHRIAELERKVDKHNNLVERMVAVEQSAKSAHHRIDGVEDRLDGGPRRE